MSRNALLLLLIALGGFAPPAFAYLDPSTGSMILSAILGLFATLALAIKTYWYRLKAFFRRDRAGKQGADKPSPDGGEPTTDN